MAAVSNIIAAGFGAWSSIEYVPTMGFGIGEAVAVPIEAIDAFISRRVAVSEYAPASRESNVFVKAVPLTGTYIGR